jgi:hypothetical protein
MKRMFIPWVVVLALVIVGAVPVVADQVATKLQGYARVKTVLQLLLRQENTDPPACSLDPRRVWPLRAGRAGHGSCRTPAGPTRVVRGALAGCRPCARRGPARQSCQLPVGLRVVQEIDSLRRRTRAGFAGRTQAGGWPSGPALASSRSS